MRYDPVRIVMTERFTRRDWRRLPEGFPAQLIHGCLVKEATPTYGHQDLVGKIHIELAARIGQRRVVLGPAAVVIDDVNVLQPDLCVLERSPAPESRDVGVPTLVFEVLSPSTRRRDETVKTRLYLRAGVAEVWLVDPAYAAIVVRTPTDRRTYLGDDRAQSSAAPGVELVPARLFET